MYWGFCSTMTPFTIEAMRTARNGNTRHESIEGIISKHDRLLGRETGMDGASGGLSDNDSRSGGWHGGLIHRDTHGNGSLGHGNHWSCVGDSRRDGIGLWLSWHHRNSCRDAGLLYGNGCGDASLLYGDGCRKASLRNIDGIHESKRKNEEIGRAHV